jgi:hypothetical protein
LIAGFPVLSERQLSHVALAFRNATTCRTLTYRDHNHRPRRSRRAIISAVDVTNAAAISGQSMRTGWARPWGPVEHQEPGIAVELLKRAIRALIGASGEDTRHGRARFHQAIIAKIAATIAATPCAVLIQSIMPAGARRLAPRATSSAWRSRVRRPKTRKSWVVIWIDALDHPNQVGVPAPAADHATAH